MYQTGLAIQGGLRLMPCNATYYSKAICESDETTDHYHEPARRAPGSIAPDSKSLERTDESTAQSKTHPAALDSTGAAHADSAWPSSVACGAAARPATAQPAVGWTTPAGLPSIWCHPAQGTPMHRRALSHRQPEARHRTETALNVLGQYSTDLLVHSCRAD